MDLCVLVLARSQGCQALHAAFRTRPDVATNVVHAGTKTLEYSCEYMYHSAISKCARMWQPKRERSRWKSREQIRTLGSIGMVCYGMVPHYDMSPCRACTSASTDASSSLVGFQHFHREHVVLHPSVQTKWILILSGLFFLIDDAPYDEVGIALDSFPGQVPVRTAGVEGQVTAFATGVLTRWHEQSHVAYGQAGVTDLVIWFGLLRHLQTKLLFSSLRTCCHAFQLFPQRIHLRHVRAGL
mmetsp:Transcript_17068/g.47270  ORF Transcript_17068/g.47270 Transcript_17068/m.47270 type:complete len:241 (+) Transcript_17068:147-869(+)